MSTDYTLFWSVLLSLAVFLVVTLAMEHWDV